jgi:hypothetical protein
MVEADETDSREKFVLWSKSDKHSREGAVLDIDTGVLRRDHVLVLRSPQAEITLGLGSNAATLMNFAQKGETRDDPLLKACDEADQAIARGDFETTRGLGVPDVITSIENSALRRLALVECFLAKASPDDPEHPGYPAGDPDGRGGKFEPKDESPEAKATEEKLKRLKSLREFRAAVRVALVAIRTAPLEAVPVVDVVVTVAAAAELARVAIELGNDETEINEALKFVRNGPYTLDQLRVSREDKGFDTFDAFKKVSPLIILFKAYGPAGDGNEYHHIVEQGGTNADNIPADQLHNTKTIVELPAPIHDLVSAEYSKKHDKTDMTVRQWLQKQPFDKQYEYGLKVLRDLGILK